MSSRVFEQSEFCLISSNYRTFNINIYHFYMHFRYDIQNAYHSSFTRVYLQVWTYEISHSVITIQKYM